MVVEGGRREGGGGERQGMVVPVVHIRSVEFNLRIKY